MSRSAVSRLLAIVIVVVVVVAVVAGFAAYMLYMPAPPAPTPTPTPTPKPTPTEEIPTEIKIGTVQHLSGPLSAISYYIFQGIQIGVQWINERGGVNLYGTKIPIKLIHYDDESNIDYSVKLVTKLIVEDKVNFIILPWGPEFTLATAPICEKYKVVSSDPTGSDLEYLQGFKYMIGVVSGHGTSHFRSELRAIREADPEAKTIAFMLSSADTGGFFKQAVQMYAQENGFEIIYETTFPEESTDLSPILREIAALKPDILVGGTFPGSAMLVATQLRDLRINIKWIVLTMAGSPQFTEALGKWSVGFFGGAPYDPLSKWEIVAAREGKEYVGPTNDEIREYWQRMGRIERIPPDVGTGIDNVVVIAKCAEIAQSLDPDKVINAALYLDMYTCRGRFKLDPSNPAHMLYPGLNHIIQRQKRDNNLVYALVYPKEFATAPLIPMPTWEEKESWPELEIEK